MIAQKEYSYLSPSMHYDPRTGEILRLNGAGLNGSISPRPFSPWATALCRQNREAFDDFMAPS